MLGISPLSPFRFSGIRLTKDGCNYQGVYTPIGDTVSINGRVTGQLEDAQKSFKRFLTYTRTTKQTGPDLQHKMQRHIQHRLYEGLWNRSLYRRPAVSNFLANAALFKEYVEYIQDIQVSPDKSKVTFRVGYPNAATPHA